MSGSGRGAAGAPAGCLLEVQDLVALVVRLGLVDVHALVDQRQ